jgi:hypothetical protein
MSQANVIRGVFGQQSQAASQLFSGFGDLSLSNNLREHFKDHILDHTYTDAVVQTIKKFKGFSVPEIAYEAAKLLGLNAACTKDLGKVSAFTSRFLAETSVGHTLASNGFVGLTPMGRIPRWFANLSFAAQALVPRRNYADNVARITCVMDTSVPVPLGSTLTGFRSDYLLPSGFGKRRWLSQIALQAVARTDVSLVNFGKVDAKVRQESAEAKADLEKAQAERANARSDKDAIIAEFAAMMAETRANTASFMETVIAATQGTVTEVVPDASIAITTAPVDIAPVAAVVAPRRKVGRPRKNPTL